MYRSAREAFEWKNAGGHFGNFRPYSLGRQMVRGPGRVLSQVRIYTGIHTPQGNAAQYAQMQRRMSAWVAQQPDKIEVFPRPVRYSSNKPPQEKGVDVELAVDFVRIALDDEADVLVLASGDTDLVPALQLVADRYPDKTLVTLGYEALPEQESPPPLDLPRGVVRRQRIPKADFDRIADKRNFYESTSDKSGELDPGRWDRIRQRYDSAP